MGRDGGAALDTLAALDCKTPRLFGLALLAAGLAACGQRTDTPSALPAPAPASSEAGYLAPPSATSVQLVHDGGLKLSGVAPAGASVEIVSPEGERAQTVADPRGRWSVRLAAPPQPRLYALSATLAGRTVHAEGAVVTAPGAVMPAVTVRAGYAALPLSAGGRTDIASVDYDPSGFIAVAGDAPPRAELTLVVDGATAAVGQADAQGRYALLAANRRLPMGPHRLQVRAPDGTPDRQVTLEPPSPLASPYQSWPGPEGWRVEWALNGGGVQTTLILGR